MYRKAIVILALMQLILITVCLNIKGIRMNRYASSQAFKVQFCDEQEPEEISFMEHLKNVTSGQRILTVNVMEKKACVACSEEDYENLLKIVEAEAGGEDRNGKLLVANVIINRVNNESFPDTISEVIFQREKGVSQFSPVSDGRMNQVKVSKETIEAVESAMMGEDISQGALYFAARKGADPKRLAWFYEKLTKLFAYGGHDFFS